MSSTKFQAIMLSKRANIFYLEHTKVIQQEDKVVFLKENKGKEESYNIPDKNTVFLFLGQGTSITNSAIRKLAESNVVVGFCGSGGTPPSSIMDYVFLSPQDEYRPTEYMQEWVRIWFNTEEQLKTAKRFLLKRSEWTKEISPALNTQHKFKTGIEASKTIKELLGYEGDYAKNLYAEMANRFNITNFSRAQGEGKTDSKVELVNSYLDHGNYLAYGYAAAILHTLGISYAFPILHGKTRKGGLIFDVADLFKDSLVLPCAFESASKALNQREFRGIIIDQANKTKVLDRTFEFLTSLCGKTALTTDL